MIEEIEKMIKRAGNLVAQDVKNLPNFRSIYLDFMSAPFTFTCRLRFIGDELIITEVQGNVYECLGYEPFQMLGRPLEAFVLNEDNGVSMGRIFENLDLYNFCPKQSKHLTPSGDVVEIYGIIFKMTDGSFFEMAWKAESGVYG